MLEKFRANVLKKTTTTTAAGTSLNKWFNEQNNGSARAL